MLDSKEQAIGYVKFSSRYFTNTALGYDDYYPFGKVMPVAPLAADDDYKFTGHQRDAELDLDYMLARNYDPLIGRFMQVDPALLRWSWKDNLIKNNYAISPYNYVRNNPIIRIDLDGYTDWSALFWGAARTSFGIGGVVASTGVIITGSGVTLTTLGVASPISVPTVTAGIGGLVYGSAEAAFGVVDMKVAWHTPDGMTAESMDSLLEIVTEGLTGSKQAGNVVGLIESARNALKIPSKISHDQLIEAVNNLLNLLEDSEEVGSDLTNEENEEDSNE